LTDDVPDSPEPEADIGAVLKQSRTDVLVSYLPVGSQQATEFYAAQALDAGCAFVNCIPVFIASNDNWRRRFAARGVPLIGDD
ncbi:inositol-3-phosphate synthase, partial [Afifella marina DSM 2698]